jgi:hypothetical protein
VAVDEILSWVERGGGRDRITLRGVDTAPRLRLLLHERVERLRVAHEVADDPVPANVVGALILERVDGIECPGRGDVLPGNADDAGEKDEIHVARQRAGRNEQRVIVLDAVAIADFRVLQSVHVAARRIEKIDAEAALLFEAAKI